ncbi:MAG: GlsB/YeaQ/YmgE family stress response membrane protein [Bauldia sp.]|nr:GlsB/YeaQ/YmgE family stress response membrane protein [Bauldia sp.]
MNNMTEQQKAIAVWVIIGLVAGLLATFIFPGNQSLIGALVAGLLGSFLGGILAKQFNIHPNLGSPIADQVAIAFVGALIILLVAWIV